VSGTLTVDEALLPTLGASPFAAIFSVTGSNWWLESVFQTLVTDNGNTLYQNGSVVAEPDLAQNWTVASDGQTYTFNLRPNVQFSNGDPFNCYQVWAEWYNVYWVEGNASNFMVGYPIFNFTGVNFGNSIVDMMNGTGLVTPSSQLLSIMQNSTWPIYCTSPSTLVIHVKSPFAYVPLVLVQFAGVMVDSQFIINNGGFGTPSTGFNSAFNSPSSSAMYIPGTGPYTMTQYVTNSYEEFQQNPNYWGANLTASQIASDPYIDPGHYKNIFVYGKTDDLVRYTDLSTGAAQIATIYSQDYPLIQQNPTKYGTASIPNQSMIIEGVGMNTLRYPTNITLVRQAIVHAINYSNIGQSVFFGQYAPLLGPEYAAFSQYYDLGNLPPYSYNLTLAMAEMNASGVNTANLQPLAFDVVAGCGVCISGAQVIQADLGAIGIPVSVNVIPATELSFPYVSGYGPTQLSISNYSQQEAQFTWMGYPSYAPNEPTPADAWIAFVNLNGLAGDYANYGNPTVQGCVNSFFSTTNQTQIVNACTLAYKQIYNDAPYIWLASPKLAFASGSVAYDKSSVASFLMDPSFTGESTTAILNTVVPAS
jgi:peptide/nickel transport system substrate-binding protein